MADQPPKRPRGRPTKYTRDIADDILHRLALGEPLQQICRNPPEWSTREAWPDMSTVVDWINDDRDGLSDRYAQAREKGWLAMADSLTDIADDGTNDWIERETRAGNIVKQVDRECTERSKLRVDTRKWLLSKMLPKLYGDRAQLDHINSDGSFGAFAAALKKSAEKMEHGAPGSPAKG